ncbi:MAG TPA: NADH-quinone oxidoreductase subunit L [Candidatus Acidoferrum sp.]|nr:NADH-quinone oxidoreductase subunit L [Candidatus Acidoferrum sp.]
MNDNLPWVILLLPLAAAVLITLFGQKLPRASAAVSVGAIVAAFFCSVILWTGMVPDLVASNPELAARHFVSIDRSFVWLKAGALHVDFAVTVDPMSLLMLLVVTGVGSLIHFFSVGYMRGDRGYPRYFAGLSFFTFSMLGVVLSNNFVQMFIFWELVGVSSYLLIGFWYGRPAAADAAKKAFLTNRLGDFGFLAGIIMIWAAAGTLNFGSLENDFIINPTKVGTIGGLLIFCGAVGKSAQFPLHVWLPDAMEGPTPVSALIHAATMVAAGVYMVCRVFFIFDPTAQTVIAWVGGGTALLAALMAVQQNDIKRILAYSTISQLGYMIMAGGLSHQPAAMFHLATHACFKALLFLGAGSVIHALSHEQDIWKMGRLKDKMPTTALTFLIGTLALCGVPPLSGFYSKDAILAAAWNESPLLFALGVITAFLTTFYMFRLVFTVFWGRAKSDLPAHAHESPRIMRYPLMGLAIASVIAGGLGIQRLMERQFFMAHGHVSLWPWWLHPFQHQDWGFALRQLTDEVLEPFHSALGPALCGLAAVLLGFLAARRLYRDAASDPLPAKMPTFCRLMRNKFYFDELYAWFIGLTQDALAGFAALFDDIFVSGGVRLISGGTELLGRGLRLAQTGNLQTYALLSAAGIAVVLYFMLHS